MVTLFFLIPATTLSAIWPLKSNLTRSTRLFNSSLDNASISISMNSGSAAKFLVCPFYKSRASEARAEHFMEGHVDDDWRERFPCLYIRKHSLSTDHRTCLPSKVLVPSGPDKVDAPRSGGTYVPYHRASQADLETIGASEHQDL